MSRLPKLSRGNVRFRWTSCVFQWKQLLSLDIMCFPVETTAFTGHQVFSSGNNCFHWTSCVFQWKQLLSLDIKCFPVEATAFAGHRVLL